MFCYRICQRQKNPNELLQDQINKYREVFKVAIERANLIDDSLAHYLDQRPIQTEQALAREDVTIFKCPKCGSNMVLKERRQSRGKYISCMGYPTCTNAIWFPEAIEDVEVLNETCNQVNKTSFTLFHINMCVICKLLSFCTNNIFSVQKIYAN